MNNTIFPYISIKPDRISLYSRSEFPSNRTYHQTQNEKNLLENSHKGLISKKAGKRIKLAIDWLLLLAEPKAFNRHKNGKFYNFKVNFITLTLSGVQEHSDNIIKEKLLNHFLVVMRQKWGVKNYVWRAEPQKRGAIHFHILTDVYIPWSELRTCWNKIQEKLGYVSQYRKKFLRSNPNSTDIHSIKKVRNLSRYLAKYCTKQSDVREIQGKQWGLSHGLSKLKSVIEIFDSKIEKELENIKSVLNVNIQNFDYCSILYVSISDWWYENPLAMKRILKEYLLPFHSAGFI